MGSWQKKLNDCIRVRVDNRAIVRIAARQTPAFRRHREHQGGCANEDVMKVHVVHWCRNTRGDRFVVQRLRHCVVRFHVALDDPFEAPVIVLAFLHHDPVQLRPLGAVVDERADHVRETGARIELPRLLAREFEILGLPVEQRLDRRLPQHLLRTEVIRDEAPIDPGRGFDFASADRVVPPLREQLDRCRQQVVPRDLRPLLDDLANRLLHRPGPNTCQLEES